MQQKGGETREGFLDSVAFELDIRKFRGFDHGKVRVGEDMLLGGRAGAKVWR